MFKHALMCRDYAWYRLQELAKDETGGIDHWVRDGIMLYAALTIGAVVVGALVVWGGYMKGKIDTWIAGH